MCEVLRWSLCWRLRQYPSGVFRCVVRLEALSRELYLLVGEYLVAWEVLVPEYHIAFAGESLLIVPNCP